MKLQVSNVYKSYGAHDILNGASLLVKGKEKIGLVGRNGCGKTTLLRIITGEEEMDKGDRFIPSTTQIGTVDQKAFTNLEQTVEEALLSVFDEIRTLEKQLSEQALVLQTDASEKQLEKYDTLQTRFDTLGGYDYEYEMKNVFFHFGFTEEDLHKKLDEFSSGQQTRIALVRLLLEKPDVLLLDEPTNHLDIESIEWLEEYISRYPSAVIIVSHDRMFLDRVCSEIVEIEYGKTTRYPGDYSHYVKAKEEWLEKNHDAYVRQQQEIQRIEALIEKFRYKATKASFAQSKIKQLEKMDRIEDSKSDTSRIHASFTSERKGGNRVMEVDHLDFGYDHPLSQVSFELFHGNRMGIVGPNGIGKSTLVRTLVGALPALGGSYQYGHQIDVGYFDQESARKPSTKTVIDELWDDHPMANQTEIRNALASFLFTGEEVFKEVNALSGGERVCLALARLMMNHDNLLILDEPTNHLDIPAREALEKALEKYDGTLLFVSHDRMFLSKMADRILDVGPISKVYGFGYDEYSQRRKDGTLPEDSFVEEKKEKKKTAAPVRNSAQEFAYKRTLTNRVAKLEELLEKAQEELESMRELRYEPEYYQDYRKMEELDQDIDEKHNEIESYTKEWEEKMLELEELA